MINALIIDDEQHNLNVLRTLLQKYCPDISIIAEADNADEAMRKIAALKPQLLFLDVKMPDRSGFDLLRMFSEINFEVIFVSAFNEYAINAFEFNALDYILKPVDFSKLVKAVSKAVVKIKAQQSDNSVLHFIKTLAEKEDLITKFSLHHNGKVIFVSVSEIIYVEAKTDLCEVNLADRARYTSSKGLRLFEDVLRQAGNFIRINKSIIINADFIKSYTKGEVCVIELKSGHSFEVSRRKKTEIIGKLRHLVN